jgi:N-acetylglucosamine malate deacetylase 1
VLAPHPDDEAIGCGGAMCRHASRGDRVSVAFLTSGELGLPHMSRENAWHIRESESQRAAEILGVADVAHLRLPDWYLGDHVNEAVDRLRPVLQREYPDTVYLPHTQESHPDHVVTLPILRRALTVLEIGMPSLRTYEVWTPMAKYDLVKDISDFMEIKLRAINCYKSQLQHFHYDRAARGLSMYRGALAARSQYAEVFGEIAIGMDTTSGVTEKGLAMSSKPSESTES